jgi:hypothetical protein
MHKVKGHNEIKTKVIIGTRVQTISKIFSYVVLLLIASIFSSSRKSEKKTIVEASIQKIKTVEKVK